MILVIIYTVFLRFDHRHGQSAEEMGKNKLHEPASQWTEWDVLRPRQSQQQGKMEGSQDQGLLGREVEAGRCQEGGTIEGLGRDVGSSSAGWGNDGRAIH